MIKHKTITTDHINTMIFKRPLLAIDKQIIHKFLCSSDDTQQYHAHRCTRGMGLAIDVVKVPVQAQMEEELGYG